MRKLIDALFYLVHEYCPCAWIYHIKIIYNSALKKLGLKFLVRKPKILFAPLNRTLTKSELNAQIKAGTLLNVRDKNGHFTPLIWAIHLNSYDIVKNLIEKGADVNIRDGKGYGWTPLIWAVHLEHADIIKLLIETGTIIDAREKNVWHKDGNGWTAVMMAAVAGNREIVKLLVEAGANINNRAGEECGHALNETVLNHMLKVFKFRSDNNENVSCKDTEKDDLIKKINMLIEFGADVNIEDDEYGNALDLVISLKLFELIKPLVKAGADINKQDDYGTYLTSAVIYGDYKLTNALIEAGANVNFIDRNGKTTLMCAVGNHNQIESNISNRFKSIKLLIEKGANVNFREQEDNINESWSILMYSIHENSDIQVIELLINAGADVNVMCITSIDANIITPLTLAKKYKRRDIIRLLEKWNTSVM